MEGILYYNSLLFCQNAPAMSSEQSVSHKLPDTALAFKLHLESGAMINMYDWMQSFISVHENKKTTNQDIKELWYVYSGWL